jgi:hypothetical protein
MLDIVHRCPGIVRHEVGLNRGAHVDKNEQTAQRLELLVGQARVAKPLLINCLPLS